MDKDKALLLFMSFVVGLSVVVYIVSLFITA